ncbi:MAG TPA: hypothetical protein VFM42_04980 [Sphingomicrobium sp.]|jgi:hypothetical protein|nr:hypothetical protein [Sphingomicrobium sp.]
MSFARPRALGILLVAILAAAALAAAFLGGEPEGPPPRPAAERPVLLLLTSLPLVFGEDFSLHDVGSPALKALETRYRVMPISVAGPEELAKGRLLMMAHPLAQPAEDLVALDEWVRAGGRVMLLADPMLEWPSKRPLGDPLRPPPMFMDTGLLAHWGLRLDAPERRGPKPEKIAGFDVATVSPGELAGQCRIGADALVAHCRIGKGRATVIADADLLDLPSLGSAGWHNMDAILTELGRLER